MTPREVAIAHYAHEARRRKRETVADEAEAYAHIGGDPREVTEYAKLGYLARVREECARTLDPDKLPSPIPSLLEV